jgi:hypothetical protein
MAFGGEQASRSREAGERYGRPPRGKFRTWRHDEYATRTFDAGELNSLEASLEEIAFRMEDAGIVVNSARQIIARRA